MQQTHKYNQVYAELLSTEETYLKHLKLLRDDYIPAAQKKAKGSNFSFELFKLHNDIKSMLAIHEQLYDNLRRYPDQRAVAALFKKWCHDARRHYEGYLAKYQETLRLLTSPPKRKLKDRLMFWKAQKPLDEKLLGAVFATPFQRVPRFKLLLQELAKNADTSKLARAALRVDKTLYKMQMAIP